MTSLIKPCPFCGSDADIYALFSDDDAVPDIVGYKIYCTSGVKKRCPTNEEFQTTERMALNRWNKRSGNDKS